MDIKYKPSLLLIAFSLLLVPNISYSTPLNAKPDGDSWKCNAGFKKQGQQCNRIFVPPNASLEGKEWICNDGYKLQGRQCNPISSISLELNQPTNLETSSETQAYTEDLELAENYYAEGEYSEALPLFQRIENERSGRAKLHLGLMHDFGYGVLTNKRLAASYYLKAAQHGYLEAQRNLAKMFSKGNAMTLNHKQAAYWFEKAAQQGDTESQYNLGNYYKSGTAGVRDYKKSTYWYRQSAEQGNLSAQYSLGLNYCIGKGVKKDLEQCALWIKRAYESGNADANIVWDKYKLWKYL